MNDFAGYSEETEMCSHPSMHVIYYDQLLMLSISLGCVHASIFLSACMFVRLPAYVCVCDL